jgi:serine/threonine-protein kinase RsbT
MSWNLVFAMAKVYIGDFEKRREEESLICEKYTVYKDDFSKAGEASSAIKKLLTKLAIPSEVIRRVAIATYEAEINIVIHSAGGEITLIITDTTLEVTASDSGPGIPDIRKALQEGFSTATDKARKMGFGAGMGLPNMIRCSDKFEINSDGDSNTMIRMTMNI